MAKKYKVGYKTIIAKLKVTREHLKKIKRHVASAKDRKDIEAQIDAMDVIIVACRTTMSRTYPGSGS